MGVRSACGAAITDVLAPLPGRAQRVDISMRFFCVIGAILLFFSFGAGAAQAAGDEVFVVARVPVQGTGETATAARQAAQSQGRRRAIDILLRRVTPEEDWVFLPTVSTGRPAELPADGTGKTAIAISSSDLVGLESGFEVYGEKASSNSYRAYITYRFKPDAIRRLLKNARLPYSEAQTRVALVLPVLQTDSGTYLWESNNPWMAAWKSRPLTHELTPMTTPIGDLEDSQTISARQALALDSGALAAIASKYGVSQVMVAHARLQQAEGQFKLSVRLINAYRELGKAEEVLGEDEQLNVSDVANTSPSYATFSSPDEEFATKVGETVARAYLTEAAGNFPALAERAIDAAIADYASGWKQKTLIDHSKEALLPVTAFFDRVADWSKIRAALIATPLVGAVQISSLSRRGAEMDVRIFGDPSKVQVAMENQGIVFWTETGDRWFLATPSVASKVRGRRFLRGNERRGIFGADDSGDDDYTPVPVNQEREDEGNSYLRKIEQ